MRNLEKGQHIFIAFQNGKAVLDSQLRPRIYISLENADKWTPTVNKGKSEYVEYAPTLTPQNDPLTIEELREMDGEPVYIISEFYHISEWNIPNGIGEIVIAYDVPCAGMKEVIPSIKFIDGKELAVEKYGSSWVAYRRPPEGEEHT